VNRVLLCGLVLLSLSAVSLAQQAPYAPGSPAANFRDDALLADAKAEIAQMRRHQLDLLTDLLATCLVTELSDDEATHRPCDISRMRYSVAYGGVNAINAVLTATELVNAVVRRARTGHVYETSRLVDIHFALSAAIAERNRRLENSSK
jgi:hypothetical protein